MSGGVVICVGIDSERTLMKALQRSDPYNFRELKFIRELKFTPNPRDKRTDNGLFELIDNAEEVAHIMEEARAAHGLTLREQEVLKLRYGLGDGFTYTYEEIGRIFCISRGRAQQIWQRALEKVRAAARVHYEEAEDYEAVRQINSAA